MRRHRHDLIVLALAGACALAPHFDVAWAQAVAPAPQHETAAALPRVRLIATGGTISNRRGGRLRADELVAQVPDLQRYVRPESEQFANTSSASLTLAQWLDLSRRINALLDAEADLAGVVVTSGTDTLEELAWFLHLTVRHDRPVVVTGAMRTPSQVAPDGAANLLAAFRVAGDAQARNRGVLVVLNDEISSARHVTKSDALRLHTFVSPTGGTLGTVDADRVVFHRRVEGRHTAASEFDVGAIETLPRVDVLLVYQDAPGDLIRAAVDFGAQGLVIATAGAGATSNAQREAMAYAAARGRPVVSTTRTGAGRIQPRSRRRAMPSPEPDWLIAGEDHTPVKARVLLMLALAVGAGPADIQRMFSEY